MNQPIKFTDPVGFSKLDTFRQCPAKFLYQFIKKLPQPSSPALERGSRLHDSCEAYLRGWIKTLPPELIEWEEHLKMLIAKNCTPEGAWGFNRNWELLSDWLHPDTWLRAKSDAHYVDKDSGTLVIIDFKSGRYRVPSTEQIELYAICGSAIYPEIEKVRTEFWFIDTKDVYSRDYTAEHLKSLRKKYEGYFAPIYKEEVWKPEPSMECRWCTYSKSKGGPCVY